MAVKSIANNAESINKSIHYTTHPMAIVASINIGNDGN